MVGSRLLPSLLMAAILCAPGTTAFAGDDITPRPPHVFLDKPRIEDYADYSAFLVDIMEYRRQKQDRQRAKDITDKIQQQDAIRTAPVAGGTAALASVGQNPNLTDLYNIRAPESLEDALERAKKLPHPVYSDAERFGRTTSTSFPIPQMEGDDMSDKDVEGRFKDLTEQNPEFYRDKSADKLTDKDLAEDPDNTDETADKKSGEGPYAMFKPGFNLSSRTMTDSQGHEIYVPLVIQNEVGFTVVHKLEIDVSVAHHD